MRAKVTSTVLSLIVLGSAVAACGSDENTRSGAPAALPQGAEPVRLDPADFTTEIDNPYFPLRPGSRWVYEEGDKRVQVDVTDRTKRLANGIEARVVHDLVTEDGRRVEDTFDWYAQDSAGNVWYLGEDTREYENGRVSSRHGSFEAGRDGAQPGIVMPARPAAGMAYRQEYYAGEAEDRARILSTREQVEVAFGHFSAVVMTSDTNPLEPEVQEYKFYARNVGPVLAITVSGGSDVEELVRFEPGS